MDRALIILDWSTLFVTDKLFETNNHDLGIWFLEDFVAHYFDEG